MIMVFFYFLFVLFALAVVFVLLTRKYQNPYKLYFVFGLKGSGKSCFFINKMLKYIKSGWIVYTDINVNIPGVRIIQSVDLKSFQPCANSVIFCDEGGLLWDNRNFKEFDQGFTEFFKLQRHFKTIVYINSQAWDVDLKIRNLIDVFYFVTNIRNCISVVRPIHRTLVPVPATAQSDARIADDLKFSHFWHWRLYWMPKYFKYYDSFAVSPRPEIPYRLVSSPSDSESVVEDLEIISENI